MHLKRADPFLVLPYPTMRVHPQYGHLSGAFLSDSLIITLIAAALFL